MQYTIYQSVMFGKGMVKLYSEIKDGRVTYHVLFKKKDVIDKSGPFTSLPEAEEEYHKVLKERKH